MLKVKEKRFMFGETYHMIETVDTKGKRSEQWIAENSEAMTDTLEDPALLELASGCNTDKDKNRKNLKIAGINVVTYPCGVILSMEELFGSESLSQVLLPVYSLMNRPTIRQSVKGNACCR